MKRSFLMSALVLALAAAIPACGGGAASGDGPKDPTTDGGGDKGSSDSGDPVVDLKNLSDGIQKDIDALFDPIRNADAVLDSVGKLPADLKAMKSKAQPKAVMAEVLKVVKDGGGDPALDALKLEDNAKAAVQDRIDKLKALMTSIKSMDDKVKDLGDRIKDALVKAPALGAKALAKIEITLKNPLAGGDAKKQAEADKATITGIVQGFKDKAAQWTKDLTDIPAKAKTLPAKLAALK
jgi:hypothetical protein